MSVLYKYLHREHAKMLLKRGKLRIGTLYEFRDIEKHGAEIGDSLEGQKSTFMEIEKEIWNPNNQPKFTKDFFNLGENSSLTIQGITLEKSISSPNYYIYSTTEVFDKSILSDFGYDSCIIIENPKKFFAAISRTLRYKGDFEGIFKCQYYPRKLPHDRDHGIHPVIIKSPEYAKQKEVRTLWKPKKTSIQPLIIECHKASKYCRLLEQ